MNDVLLMQELERLARLSDDLCGLLFAETNAIQGIVKILALQMLLHDEKVLTVLENVIHSNDVRMACVHQHFEFIDE